MQLVRMSPMGVQVSAVLLKPTLVRYLGKKPKQARYGAALFAVASAMSTWQRWSERVGDECPYRVARAPFWAQGGVEQWLTGRARVDELCGILRFVEEARGFVASRNDVDAALALIASDSALSLLLAAISEDRGIPANGHLADAVLAAALVRDGPRSPRSPAYLAVWLKHVEKRWNASL